MIRLASLLRLFRLKPSPTIEELMAADREEKARLEDERFAVWGTVAKNPEIEKLVHDRLERLRKEKEK